MKKIPSLFKRDYEGTRRAYDELVPGCEWVLAGEGVATLKLDGTACLVNGGGYLYKRYDAKKGKTPSEGWIPCEDAPDKHTQHWPGWLPVGNGPDDRWHREAYSYGPVGGGTWAKGTYELLGPKVQGNPYDTKRHVLIKHGEYYIPGVDRTFIDLKAFFEATEIEGIVFWRNPKDHDCEKAKVKRKDFGFQWPPKKEKGDV